MTEPRECQNCGFTYTGPCPTCDEPTPKPLSDSQKLAIAVKALEWYAESNIKDIFDDMGDKAREALEEIGKVSL
jgi:hypothetical protein